MITATNSKCSICKKDISTPIKLPKFPLTGIFSDHYDKNFANYDQELQFCDNCGHGQLKNIIDPNILYGSNYGFSTSDSETSIDSEKKFINFIKRHTSPQSIKFVLEFGSNDLHFLENFAKKDVKCIGIDPMFSKKKEQHKNIKTIPDYIENINFKTHIKEYPSLICSRHTIEHIYDITKVLEKLKNISNKETIFAFEFPSLELLVQKRRFDQIFHEHVHYYSLSSFKQLLKNLNFELISYEFNYIKGAIYTIFKNKDKQNKMQVDKTVSKQSIKQGYADFQTNVKNCKNILDTYDKKNRYAYGASLLLPSLSYHFDNYFKKLNSILDDDEHKIGKKYINVNLDIDFYKDTVIYEDAVILITALEHTRAIVKKLIAKNTKNILIPSNSF